MGIRWNQSSLPSPIASERRLHPWTLHWSLLVILSSTVQKVYRLDSAQLTRGKGGFLKTLNLSSSDLQVPLQWSSQARQLRQELGTKVQVWVYWFPAPDRAQTTGLGLERERESQRQHFQILSGPRQCCRELAPCLNFLGLQGHAGVDGWAYLYFDLKIHPGKINFGENSSLGQAGSERQPSSAPEVLGFLCPVSMWSRQDST